MTSLFGPWGLVPFAVPMFAFVAARLGALAFKGQRASVGDRAAAGILLAFALVIATVRALSCVHAVATAPLALALVVAALGLGSVARGERFVWPPRSLLRDAPVVGALLLAAAALGLAAFAARQLPVWQWDALGYHLPFVHFTLDARSVDGVPPELEYVGSYPHDVELFFVALRACLSDDRLVDLGQVPFALAGALVTSALARRSGASARAAIVAGVSWLVVPAVLLQAPTDYVDVATATFLLAAVYFALASPSRRSVVLCGLAVGLLAGSKPSGPLPGAVIFVVACVRAYRAGERASLGVATALALVFGAGAYVDNVLRYGNPLWPVAFDAGPLHLPGTHSLSSVLSAGGNAPHLEGRLPVRFVRSLLAVSSTPVFDMRVGGFGLLTLLGLPLASAWLVRQRDLATYVVFGCSLLSPDASLARYVLAFPALVLVGAACLSSTASRLPRAASSWALLGVVLVGLGQLVYAAPGLTGEGPSLSAYAAMSESERVVAVGADGRPEAVVAARARVGAGEVFAFDESMDLCDLAWDGSGRYRVLFLPPRLSSAELERLLRQARVVVAGAGSPAEAWASAHANELERAPGRVSCREGRCAIYVRR